MLAMVCIIFNWFSCLGTAIALAKTRLMFVNVEMAMLAGRARYDNLDTMANGTHLVSHHRT